MVNEIPGKGLPHLHVVIITFVINENLNSIVTDEKSVVLTQEAPPSVMKFQQRWTISDGSAQITGYEAKGRPTIGSYCIMAGVERPCSFELRDDYTFGVLHYRDLEL